MFFLRLRPVLLRSSDRFPRSWYSTARRKPLNIVFFGSDLFSDTILEHLYRRWKMTENSPIDNLEVMTTISSSNIIRNRAETLQLKTHLWPQIDPLLTRSFDLGILASFGQLLPKRVIEAFPQGILNVHPSLLPRWRGSSPLVYTIASGDRVGGVSIMEIRAKHFDIGPLLMQESFPLSKDITMVQLLKITAQIGCRMIDQILEDPIGVRKNTREQSSTDITYAHKLSKASFYIDWHHQTTEEIDRLYRALNEIGNLRTIYREKPVRLKSFRSIDDEPLIEELNRISTEPGRAIYNRTLNSVLIRCQNGWVGFDKLSFRKSMTARDFHNGYLSKSAEFQFQSVHNPLFDHVHLPRLK